MIWTPDRKLWTPPRNVVMPRPWRRQRGFFVPMAMHKSFTVGSADFDGTNDYMARGAAPTGIADSKIALTSIWFRIDAVHTGYPLQVTDTGATQSYFGFNLAAAGTTSINFVTRNSGGTIIAQLSASLGSLGSTWHHLVMDCDMTRAPSSPVIGYLDDSSITFSVTTATDDTIDFTRNNCFVGTNGDASLKWNGCLAEVYFAPGQSMDTTVEANRRKFYTSSGKPAYLGADGSKPTGTAPIVYHSLKKNQAASGFAANKGTGGDFSITGSLDIGSSSPSD